MEIGDEGFEKRRVTFIGNGRGVGRQEHAWVVIKRVVSGQRLGIGHIQAGAGDYTAVQRLQQRLLIDQPATGDIDQVQAWSGLVQYVPIDQPTGVTGEWGGQHEVVALCEQLS